MTDSKIHLADSVLKKLTADQIAILQTWWEAWAKFPTLTREMNDEGKMEWRTRLRPFFIGTAILRYEGSNVEEARSEMIWRWQITAADRLFRGISLEFPADFQVVSTR